MSNGPASARSRVYGFTLVELIIAIALLAIVVSLAVPAYSDFMARKRASAVTNDFLVDLNAARGEATRRRRNVVMCVRGGSAATCDAASQNSGDCTCAADGQWESGWITFVDADADASLDASATDTIVGVHPPLPGGVTLRRTVGAGNTVAFNSRGALAGTTAGFAVCVNDAPGTDDDADVLARARFINVALTGRAAVSSATAAQTAATTECTP